MREMRAYAWAQYMGAAMLRTGDIASAAAFADQALAEWERRFGACPTCKGSGRVRHPGSDHADPCPRCDGTGRDADALT